ncbi:MAG: hypothetical protein CMK89_23110 [Pseudomonadales bacterium]|nr:hypothetical protein [Pseudomonadales bacterium]
MNSKRPSFLTTLGEIWSVKRNLKALTEDSSGTFYLINGLRFFGMVWILIAHTVFVYSLYNGKEVFFQSLEDSPFYLWWIWNADKGVDLFFVVSGFLISLMLLKEQSKTGDIQLKRFYLRRYLRLTPLYAVIAIIFWFSGARNHEWIWANLLYVNNFLHPDNMALQWTWTLAVEEQFYLLLPLILIFIAKSPQRSFMKTMLGLLVLSFLIRAGVLYYYDELWNGNYRDMLSDKSVSMIFYGKLYDNLATRFGPLIVGVIAGYGYCFHQQAIRNWATATPYRPLILNVLSMGTIVFFMYFPIIEARFSEPGNGLRLYLIFNRTIFSVAFTWFMMSVFLQLSHVRLFSWFYSLKIWHPLGQLTYSIYLLHLIVILMVVFPINKYVQTLEISPALAMITTVGLGAVLSLIVSVIMGVLCWILIEKPFLNMRDLFAVNRGAPKPTAEPIPKPAAIDSRV